MSRLRLFLFFTAVAWASVFDPSAGQRMVLDAEDGAAMRLKRRAPARIPRIKAVNWSAWLGLLLMALSAVGVVWTVYALLVWWVS